MKEIVEMCFYIKIHMITYYYIIKSRINFISNRGWNFSGERMSNHTFNSIMSGFEDPKNTSVYSKDKELVLMRGKQLAFKLDVAGYPSEWCITFPNGYLPFAVQHIPKLRKIRRNSNKI